MQRHQKNTQIRVKNFKYKKQFLIKNVLLSKMYKVKPTCAIDFIYSRSRVLFFYITICSNNVFCLLKTPGGVVLCKLNSGESKIKITGKRLKSNLRLFLFHFLTKSRRYLYNKMLIVKIVSPLTLKKSAIKYISEFKKINLAILDVTAKKCFNGCRPAKMRRKKRKGVQLFKE